MGLNFLLLYYRRPEIRNVYIFMGAKKTVQQTMPIRPDFAQVAGTLLDPQLRVKSRRSHPLSNEVHVKCSKRSPLLRSPV